MPIHTVASTLQNVDRNLLFWSAVALLVLRFIKAKAGGRKSTWEREWAGKMILISSSPSPTILQLVDHLLHLPSPPQILFLPPCASPLPESLTTIMNIMRVSITNPMAQLHCEAVPPTPAGVRDFVARWGKTTTGMTGEGGRRIDAIVMGTGWEVDPESRYFPAVPEPPVLKSEDEKKSDTKRRKEQWTVHEYQFHLITSLIPNIMRQPPERNIRIVSLISPTYSAALPTLLGKRPKADSLVQITGAKSITFIYLMKHLQLIFDTLSAAALKAVKDVPTVDGVAKKREDGMESNVMVLRVIMPWTRDEVIRGMVGIYQGWIKWFLWILLYPLLALLTPSPRQASQSILFALQAPVRYGPLRSSSKPSEEGEISVDPRRSSVGNADVVQDCSVIDLPPVLQDPHLARVTYEALEKDVTRAVKLETAKAKASDTERVAG